LPQPPISDGIISAYLSASYRVQSSGETFILHIDQYSEPLSRLLVASGHHCAAFITACNPWGKLQSPEANSVANSRLADQLWQRPGGEARTIEGAGYDPRGTWPEEKSFLVLGLDLEASRALGREFNQNAIVWTGADAIPRLILLR
jgi:hypothetical protein